MTLLIIGLRWPPETFIQRKLSGLARSGFRIIATTTDRVPAGSRLDGVEVLRTPSWNVSIVRRLFEGIRMTVSASLAPRQAWRLFKLVLDRPERTPQKLQWLYRLLPLAGIRPTAIHFEWNSAAALHLPLFDAAEAPIVVSCRGRELQIVPHNPESRRGTHVFEEVFRKAAAVHCVSERMSHEAANFSLDPMKASIIRPAVDPEFFRPSLDSKLNAGPLRIATVGSLGWSKGYEYCLMALRILLDRGCPAVLHIVGDGSKGDWQRLRYTVDDLGLGESVELHGALPPLGVRRILQCSDVFLLASLSEGIANSVLEAMSCGIPVVTTDCGGMKEAVTDGVEGYVVGVRDSRAMAERLETLARDPALRRQMGEAARTRVLRQFTLERQNQLWVDLYRRVTAAYTDAPADSALSGAAAGKITCDTL